MYLPRTLNEMLAELFLMLLVATQVIMPSSAFIAGEKVSTPLLILILRPCSTSKSPSLSYLKGCNICLHMLTCILFSHEDSPSLRICVLKVCNYMRLSNSYHVAEDTGSPDAGQVRLID